MAFPVNQVRFEGNLVADGETKTSQKGTTVSKFRMAHNVSRKNEDGQYEDTPIFFGVTLFGREAEDVASSLVKGTRVLVEGRLDPPRTFEGKNGTGVGLDIIADRVLLVTRPQRAASGNGVAPVAAASRGAATADDLEDLPF